MKLEKEIREKISNEIKNELKIALENCACLGRDAYGDYIDKCVNSIIIKIKNQ